MFRCITKITIKQNPTDSFPKRGKIMLFDFVNEFEAEDSWSTLTNNAKITLPKKIFYFDEHGKKKNLWGVNKNIGGFTGNDPFFLRGDSVTIEYGYKYFNKQLIEIKDTSLLFSGFISKIKSGIPIVLECQDNSWKLKQIAAPNKEWPRSTSLENILKELLKGTPFTINMLTNTIITFDIGGFRTTKNETVADVLARLRRDYHLEAYWRGNELRCGSKIYLEAEAITHNFKFQQNVVSDALDYNRKEDIILSAVAHNYVLDKSGVTSDGQQKTKRRRIEVLVMFRFGKFESFIKEPNKEYPVIEEGERRTFFYPWAKTAADLITLAKDELVKYYYTGLKGSFTTFAIPFVKQGDNANIVDNVLPERNGAYKIKSVKYTGGVNGHRQELELDYRITVK